jgi:hypothetical protein
MKILLPLEIELRGSCSGIIGNQVERTDTKALYRRSDGYWECFRIIVIRHNIYDNGAWIYTGNTIERYPSEESFGVSAWCGREKTIREQYERLNAVSDIDVSTILPRSPVSNAIVPLLVNKG